MKTFLPLLLVAAPASAAGFQNLDALESRLTAALGAGIGEPGGPLAPIDRRLHLAQCPQTVAIDPPAMGAVALRCASLGWRLRVPLQRLAGTAAGPAAAGARAEPAVRRGDPVDLVAGDGGFTVSVAAVAQEDGAPGARIRVKTESEGKPQGQILFAEVIEAGRVALPGFKD